MGALKSDSYDWKNEFSSERHFSAHSKKAHQATGPTLASSANHVHRRPLFIGARLHLS